MDGDECEWVDSGGDDDAPNGAVARNGDVAKRAFGSANTESFTVSARARRRNVFLTITVSYARRRKHTCRKRWTAAI